MGRKPDDPEVQEAKGNPGKRPLTTAQRLKEARILARLLARHTDGQDEYAPPAVLTRKGGEAALAIWRDAAPKIAAFGVFDGRFDRHAFAQYCVWTAEFYAASQEYEQHGRLIPTPMTNGGEMMRLNPALKVMQIAFGHSMALAEKFGLTPLDRARLLPQLPKVWDKRPDARPAGLSADLFAPDAQPSDDAAQHGAASAEAPSSASDEIGALGAFRGARLQ